MMPSPLACSKEATLRLFYNSSSFFLLFFLFSYSSSILLSKLFHFFCCAESIPQRVIDDQDGFEFETFWTEEDEAEQVDQYFYEEDQPVADDDAGEISRNDLERQQQQQPFYEFYPDNQCDDFTGGSQWPPPPTSARSSPETEWLDMEHEFHVEDGDRVLNEEGTPIIDSTIIDQDHRDNKSKSASLTHGLTPRSHEEVIINPSHEEVEKGGGGGCSDEKCGIEEEEDVFGDSCTVGSTSKSSSDWRSSNIFNRDSGMDDPFSSSSRRSCRNWESYAVFQKYDEERMFLDRLCAQKLHETESLRCIQACPRSISERIVHKLAKRNKTTSARDNNNVCHHDSLRELEATYVAQVCLTWEALNWNYKNFRSKMITAGLDPGCPARVAQRFQQFQVMLQRYIENEPYEHGRRPEVYAKMRKITPMLLLVPEYCADSEQYEHMEEGFSGSKISSASFLKILEDGIRTFMRFLKADRENCCKVLIQSFFNKKRRNSVDPTLISLYKKVNKKKRAKLENIRRGNGKCFKKRKLNEGAEMETLMGLIDLKLVSRVLRMADLSDEQLQWCEAKMHKVRISEGRLQRDSSPLFFPAHAH